MKKNVFSNASKLILMLAVTAVAATGCLKDKETGPRNPIPSPDNYFGFETRVNVNLSINYGVPGFQALFKVFAENPLQDNTGSLILKEGVEPIYTAYTDKDGKFDGVMSIPSMVKEVYLYTDRWGVSGCVKLELAGGRVAYDARAAKTAKASRVASSASDMAKWFVGAGPYDLTTFGIRYDLEPGLIYSSVKWTINGEIQGVNSASDVYMTPKTNNETIADISERAQAYLATLAMGEERAKLLVTEPEVANITTKEDATKLQVVFLDERGAYANTFGYYYYKKTEAPSSNPNWFYDDFKVVKKYIVFPHAAGDQGALTCGETVALKFYGEKGDKPGSYDFPKDYVIGWFLVPQGFITASNNLWMPQYSIADGLRVNNPSTNRWGTIISTNDIKTASTDFRRFITLYDAKSKSVVIGVEDVKNERVPDDYCDLTFIVTSDKGLDSDNKPEIPDVPQVPSEDNSFKGTLAFEDIWPSGGDYDMNDVVVEYSWNITFDKDNNVTGLEEKYTPVHDGAALRNLFAYQLPYGTVASSSDFSIETSTNSVIINPCLKDCQEQTFVVKRAFSSNVKKDVLKDKFNPYIIVNETNRGQGRKEVHLPKHLPTDMADKSLNYTQEDAYYMKKDGKYPFAINIPILNFEVAPEKMKIDEAYPAFRSWVESNGVTDADWYLHKK